MHQKRWLSGRPGRQAGRRGLRLETAWLAALALAPSHWWQCSSENVFSCVSTVPPNTPLPAKHNITMFCFEWGWCVFANRCNSQIGGALENLKPASAQGRAALNGAALLCRVLYFFHAGEKNPDSSHFTDPKRQIFAVCPAFSISGRGEGFSWLPEGRREDPAGR